MTDRTREVASAATRVRSAGRIAAGSGLVAVALLAVACSMIAPKVPSVVGVVADVEEPSGPIRRFTVESGEYVDLDLDTAYRLTHSQGGSAPGTLFFTGEQWGTQWYMSLTGDGECFLMDDYGTDAGENIHFDNGLLLPKAPDFDPGYVTDGNYDKNPQGHFCIDREGRVVSYGP